MTCFKRIILVLMAVAAIFSVSCTGGKGEDTTDSGVSTTDPNVTDAPPVSNEIVIAENGESKYTIVYSAKRSQDEMVFAIDVSMAISKTAKTRVEYKPDSEVEASDFEILIGDTSRPESAKAKELLGAIRLI